MILDNPLFSNDFNELNARVNLGPTQFTASESPTIVIEEGEHKIVSLDENSHFVLQQVQVDSIEHFAYIANGDLHNPSSDLERRCAAHPRLAPELHTKDLAAHQVDDWMARAEQGIEAFSAEEQFMLYEAMSVFLNGHADQIQHLAAAANRLFFPVSMGLFTADHLILKDHAQLSIVGTAPVFMNVGKLELHGASTIHVHAPVIGFAQTTDLVGREPHASLMLADTQHGLYPSPSFNYVPAQLPQAQDGADGHHGDQPSKATPNGKSHKTTTGNCPYKCDTEPGAGQKGGTGDDGDDGTPGNNGTDYTNPNTINLGKISGVLTLNYGGGTGQQGGKGGNGGEGGEGGQPGDSATGCTTKTQGDQGQGGAGGRGGNGGKGGTSVTTRLVWEGTATVNVGYNLDNGGAAGPEGVGGAGKPTGGSKGPGTPGAATPPGNLILPTV
ncbi:hypothetical protein [uncultured Tateyamaria sp.]|uniref:hypothetical protein n=1 Tax=uncultured Tateyamaria sp. TaxID=455651 RepID=UPI002608677C|nr:hypothetical protein [uncultured Tateyamaria sp.]